MTPAQERKVLREILEQLDDPEATMRKQTRMRGVILGLGIGGTTAAFFLAMHDLLDPLAAAALAAASGCALGFAVFLRLVQSQWPVTSKYVDVAGVKKRLNELDGRRA